MALSRRQRLTVISLLLYWPAIFILTHIPIPVPWLIAKAVRGSDKTLHFLAYFILVFLLWFAISPNRKINWRKATAWWVLFVVVWYGVFDEWLQGYVGRHPDIKDFFADLAGTLTCLILLSIFPFWPVCLVVTGATILILTSLMQANLADLPPVINAVFHLFAYAFFSLLWIRYMYFLLPTRPPELKWLIGALVLPAGFLLAAESFSAITGNSFRIQNIFTSLIGIVVVVATFFLIALFRRKLTQKPSLP